VLKKFVPCDGGISLITYSNASNFAFLSHMQNFVLQNQQTNNKKILTFALPSQMQLVV